MMHKTIILASVACAWAQPEITPHEAPLCQDVWDPLSPPSIAHSQIVGTVAAMDAAGVFSGVAGVEVLQGSVPWTAYVSALIYLGTGMQSPSADELYCREMWGALNEVSSNQTIDQTIIDDVVADMIEYNTLGMTDPIPINALSIATHMVSYLYTLRRMCPCVQKMTRAWIEPLNCRTGPTAVVTLAELYFPCHAVDYKSVFAGVGLNNSRGVDWSQDKTQVTDWKACNHPMSDSLFGEETLFGEDTFQNEPLSVFRSLRNAAHQQAVTEFNIVPAITQPGPPSGNWLDDTWENCIACDSKKGEKAVYKAYKAVDRNNVTKDQIHDECYTYIDFKPENGGKGGKGGKGAKGGKGRKQGGKGKKSALSAFVTEQKSNIAIGVGLMVLVAGVSLVAVRNVRKNSQYNAISMEEDITYEDASEKAPLV